MDLLNSGQSLFACFNPILDGVFGHPILDGGRGGKKAPHLNFEQKQDNEAKFGMKIPLSMKNSKT